MKKLTFLVYHKEYMNFLENLQDKGLVHVIIKESGEIENETIKEKYELIYRLSSAISFLERREIANVETKKTAQDTVGEELLEELENVRYDTELYQQKLSILNKERTALLPWGDFSLEKLNKIEEQGYTIQFFTCPVKSFKPKWIDEFNALEVADIGSTKYFITISESKITTLDAEEIKKPERTLSEVLIEIEKTEKTLIKAEDIFDDFASKYIPALIEKRKKTEQEFTFEKVVVSTDTAAEDKIMILEGWVPKEKEENIVEFLNKQGIYYEINNPTLKDKVPIQLKNNKFARLFEVIGDLYSRPKYSELDLTPYFAPFYWLFFGFCLGDAGYGLIFLLLGIIMIFKGKKEMRNIFKLVSLLGISTILFGIIGGTFFGISLYEIKFGFYAGLAERFDAQNKTINDHLFSLALLLGAIQILFGMLIKIANQIKMYNWKYALGTIGWLIIIIGSVATYLLSGNKDNTTALNLVKWSTIILGALGAFVFNNPERNIFINIGSGLWDAYNMLTGIMGDLLSYIRLFALGISSAILGYVFNSLAMEFAPENNIIGKILVMTFILIFGHGINLFMAALGSFVHPVRLTFVEFYKNAGFSGGGIKFSPFSNKNN